MRAIALLGLLAGAQAGDGIALRTEMRTEGPIRKRVSAEDAADVVLVYGGEQSGELGDCGCASRPRGALSRVETVRRLLAERDPVLLLDAGAFLDDVIDVTGALPPRNAAMLRGLAGWHALNVTSQDLPWLERNGFPPSAVSANVRPTTGEGPSDLLVLGDVAVTGVSAARDTFLAPERHVFLEPVEAVRAVAARNDAPVLVVLAWGLSDRVAELAAVEGVDVVIDANGWEASWEAWEDGDTVIARSRLGTRRLGELRLQHTGGRLHAATERWYDLDDSVPEDPALRRLAESAR